MKRPPERSHGPFPEFEAVEVFDHREEVKIRDVVDLETCGKSEGCCAVVVGGDNRICLIGY